EVVPALAEAFPGGCVVDGEIVVAGPGGALDFDTLQMRIHPAASRIRMLSEKTPASFIAFDLLAEEEEDLRSVPFAERRARLEVVLKEANDPSRRRIRGTQILLTPQTDDAEKAEAWFDGLSHLGVEGVVAKRPELGYR